MATTNSDLENEVKSWLKIILKGENLQDFSVSVSGNSEKGDGYMGDIIFASVDGIINHDHRKCDFVLKCSKSSETLRKAMPAKEAFLNEIVMYEKILPYFTKFQKEKGIEDPFDSIPKCYGSITRENMEIIVLENMKSGGYELWPKKQPLTRKHIDMIITKYGKLHATSLAIEIQQPKMFHNFVDSLINIFDQFCETSNIYTLFGNPVDESYELLQNEMEEHILQKWKGFKDQITFICHDMLKDVKGIKVLLHGDCWNNNFMHLHEKGQEKNPLKVAFLDWQTSRHSSPVLDLAYFLFSCISEEDLEQLDDILKTYHVVFVDHLRRLGVETPDVLYPLEQFLDDWRSYSRYGVMMTSLLMKVVSTDKDEVIDMAEIAESGRDIGETFMHAIKDKDNFRKRMRPLVEYVVKHGLI